MSQHNHTQDINFNQSLDIVKAHDVLQRYIAEMLKSVADTPHMPNGTSIKKAVDCIGKLTHTLVDYLQHNNVLIEENSELYRQVELRQAECDAYLEEINSLQSQLHHWKEYYAANANLFMPAIINSPANSHGDASQHEKS